MFERFTERARQVVVLAQEEARTLKHNYIGTEHILLGLLREEPLAARVLEVSRDEVREVLARIRPAGEARPAEIPFSEAAEELLAAALREALSRGHDRVGTEHVLFVLVGDERHLANVRRGGNAIAALAPREAGAADRLVERLALGIGTGAETIKAAFGREAAAGCRSERLRCGLVRWAVTIAVTIFTVSPAAERAIRVVERESKPVTAVQTVPQEQPGATRR